MSIMKLYSVIAVVGFLCFTGTTHGAWTYMGSPGDGYIRALAADSSSIFACDDSSVFLSKNNDTSWININNGLPKVIRVTSIIMSGNEIFACADTNGVYLSTNSGASWSLRNTGLPAYPAHVRLHALAVSGDTIISGGSIIYSDDTAISMIPSSTLFFSTNNGALWSKFGSGGSCGLYVTALSMKGDTVFAGCSDFNRLEGQTNGCVSRIAGNDHLRSDVGGIPIYMSNFAPSTGVISLAVCGDYIWAATVSGDLYRSTINGTTFSPMGGGSILAVSGNALFVGGYGLVFFTTDNGKSWGEDSTGLPKQYIGALCINSRNFYAGTYGYGVWRKPLSEIIAIIPQNQKTTLLQTKLHINAAGNIRSGINIDYSIASSCLVRLGIYSISGKQIECLKQGKQEPGEYRVTFAIGSIPAGIYICRLQAGNILERRAIHVMQ